MSQVEGHDRLMAAIHRRLADFLAQEIGIEARQSSLEDSSVQRLDLRPVTSILSVEGNIRMMVAFSFEQPLIEHILEVYSEGIEVADDEHEIMIESTAAEVINIVVGNATADVQVPGALLSISPPVVMGDAKSITRHRGTQFSAVDLMTGAGAVKVYFVFPRERLDEQPGDQEGMA